MRVRQLVERLERFRGSTCGPHVKNVLYQLAVRGHLSQRDELDVPPPGALLASAIPADGGEWLLPSTWYWIHLGAATEVEMGQSPPSEHYNNAGIGLPFFQGKADFGARHPSPRVWCDRPSKIAETGDILLSVRAPIGPTNVADTTCCIGRGLAALRPKEGLSVEFLLLALKAREAELAALGFGTTFTAIGRKQLTDFQIPLPPPSEQVRIVQTLTTALKFLEISTLAAHEEETAREDLLESLLHKIEADSARGQTNSADVLLKLQPLLQTAGDVQRLRQTLIKLGVRGRLTAQDPNDEPAEQLLKRIEGSSGVIHTTAVVRPFALPSGWAWSTFPRLGRFGRGRSKHRPRNDPALFEGGTHPLVQTGDVARSRGTVTTFTGKYNEVGLSQSRKWPAGTMCITIAANIADTGLLSFDACFPDSVVGFIPAPPMSDARFFEYFMRTAKANLQEFAPATAQKNISLEILNNVAVPVPPVAEQGRIVDALDSAMSLCDALEEALLLELREEEVCVDATIHALLNECSTREQQTFSVH